MIIEFSLVARAPLFSILKPAIPNSKLFLFQRRQYRGLRQLVVLRQLVLSDPVLFRRLRREQLCSAASIEPRFKDRNPAQAPEAGYEILRQRAFECVMRIQADQ